MLEKEYTFIVEGHPRGWQRTGGQGRKRFTRPATRIYQEKIRQTFVQKYKRLDDETHEWIVFIMVEYKGRISDLDNILKMVLDALQPIVWTNDARVRRATIEKIKVKEAEMLSVALKPIIF